MADRAKLGRANRRKGKRFERDVCKMIANHFGWPWKEFADRAGSGHEQKHDGITLDQYTDLFPFYWEAKYRQNWGFKKIFGDVRSSKLYQWFKETEQSTASSLEPLLVFSKPYYPTFVLTRRSYDISPRVVFSDTEQTFYIYEFDKFLQAVGSK